MHTVICTSKQCYICSSAVVRQTGLKVRCMHAGAHCGGQKVCHVRLVKALVKLVAWKVLGSYGGGDVPT
jgi:hypothetical protein